LDPVSGKSRDQKGKDGPPSFPFSLLEDKMDILVTKRLTLRPPLEVDIDDIAEFIGNPNVSRMLARVPHPYFPKDAEEWIGNVSKNVGAGLDMAFTMHRERLIGIMSLEGFDGVPEFGYWLAEPYWGKGFATEAGAAVLAHAFKTRDVERVVSGVFKDNPASLNVQKKLGFRLTGSGPLWSVSRGEMVEHVTTELTRRDFVAAGHDIGNGMPKIPIGAALRAADSKPCPERRGG
jgi:RimJ/RimL family protein N-acetyltransferase